MNYFYPTKLTWLNHSNATGEIQQGYLTRLMDIFKEPINALEVGCAYGGGVEMMARTLGDRGMAYGFDTFEGHPKDLSDDTWSKEATCMDYWYHHTVFGMEKLDVEYQRSILKEEGLGNAKLIKGRVNKDSFNDIVPIHLALVDLDLIKSTEAAYEGLKDRFAKGGYFIMHDSLPADHLPMINDFVYNTMLKDGRWELEKESVQGLCTVLKKI